MQATARYWAQEYANVPGVQDETMTLKVTELKEKGVTQADALSALSCNGWDLKRAANYIFS